MAWQVTPSGQFEPELARPSEVEVQFTEEENGMTRVDLEHRHFEWHGEGFDSMRVMVDSPDGGGTLVQLSEDRVAA
jgi:hypothetical protein